MRRDPAVGVGVDELLREITVGGVEFDAVTTRRDRVACGLDILTARAGNLLDGHGPGRRMGLHPLAVGPDLTRELHRGGGEHLSPLRQIR